MLRAILIAVLCCGSSFAAIARTALGTANSKAATTPWTALTSITVTGGASIFVAVSMIGSSSTAVTWNGTSLTADVVQESVNGNLNVWSLHNATSGTGSIVITSSIDPSAVAMFATQVTGLATSSVFDKKASAEGTSTTPSSGATAATTQASEFILGALATYGPSGDAAGTWTGDTTSNGQRAGTTGGGASSNVTVSEGFLLDQVSTGARTASKTGITSRLWECDIATYKAAGAAAAPKRLTTLGVGD